MVEPARAPGGLARFLRENWLWIVGPIALVVVLLAVLAFVFGQDENAPFIYPIF